MIQKDEEYYEKINKYESQLSKRENLKKLIRDNRIIVIAKDKRCRDAYYEVDIRFLVINNQGVTDITEECWNAIDFYGSDAQSGFDLYFSAGGWNRFSETLLFESIYKLGLILGFTREELEEVLKKSDAILVE